MGNKELLEINTLEDLLAAKAALRTRIKQREKDLQERSARLPIEVIKATAGSVVPFFLNNKIAGATWQLVKGIFSMVFTRKANGKENIFASAKKWGWVTLAKAVYGIFMK